MNKIARYMKTAPNAQAALFRTPQPTKPAGLYLLALRSHHAEAHSPLPKRRLVITVYPQKDPNISPTVIKITHR